MGRMGSMVRMGVRGCKTKTKTKTKTKILGEHELHKSHE